tara:strand:- start:1803 stop:2033 length:231 start_codon:yes stop_codon:yes gene_type:complete
MNIENALSALDEILEAAQSIRDAIETAADDVDQQIEDGELRSSERERATREITDGTSEGISVIRGQADDLAEALDD